MESILQDVLKLINDAMGYLRLFVIGGTAFFVAKDYALKMASSDDNQKASYDRKIKTKAKINLDLKLTTGIMITLSEHDSVIFLKERQRCIQRQLH